MSTELTPITSIAQTGVTPNPAAVDDAGNWFTNPGGCYLHILSGGVGGFAVTVHSQALCNQGVEHDLVIACVAAATVFKIGPLPKTRFDDADGKVQITYAAGAFADGMKAEVFKLP